MSVLRPMGTETEYAVVDATDPRANPVQLSFDVIAGAGDPATDHIRWDYRGEDPVNDARGYRLERASARPEMLTDSPQLQLTNAVAPNGGRIYVDHAHPEYSAPETIDPFEAVLYDHAGDLLMLDAARRASASAGRRIELYRNNVDGKGASWGSHESYQISRSVPFDDLTYLMTLHFVTRQIYCGSGRLGLGERNEGEGFQLSQRADYLHAKVGLQTTFDRPIINTRDESHSTDGFRRLHVIVGDANCMDVPEALKLGTTSMVAWLAEEAVGRGESVRGLLDGIELADPVAAIHTVSHDLTLCAPLPVVSAEAGRDADGTGFDADTDGHDRTSVTAWQIQVRLRSAVYRMAAAAYGTDIKGEPLWPDDPTRRIMTMWGTALEDAVRVAHADDDERLTMTGAAGRLEWLLKWQLMEKLRRRRGLTWSDPKLHAMDIAWAALEPRQSIFHAVKANAVTLNDERQLRSASVEPPEHTRAWLRSAVVKRFPGNVVAVSWSSITVRDTHGTLHDIDIADPRGHDAEACAKALESARDVDAFLAALA